MRDKLIGRLPPYATVLAVLVCVGHLAWEWTHGGVRSHHLLDRADLPAVSNAWGLVVLPALGWFAAFVVQHRAAALGRGAVTKAGMAWLGAMVLGVALSTAFVTGYPSASSALFLTALAAGLILPTYRGEYMFGFVLGMTFTFGAVLPTLVAIVAAAISLAFHRLVRPTAAWAWRRVRP